jgi:hypothetical protein
MELLPIPYINTNPRRELAHPGGPGVNTRTGRLPRQDLRLRCKQLLPSGLYRCLIGNVPGQLQKDFVVTEFRAEEAVV